MIKNNDVYLERRIRTDFTISDDLYVRSILDITEFLWYELEYLLKKENRFFGITVSYMNSITNAFKKINLGCTSEDCDIFGQVLYLYKPLLVREFRKLEKRRISQADCIIIIIKRLMEILIECKEDPHFREMKTLDKIITRLYDNIRHSGKTANLYSLISNLKKYREEGLIGKYCVDQFCLYEEATWKEKIKYTGDTLKLDDSSNGKVMEVLWTGE